MCVTMNMKNTLQLLFCCLLCSALQNSFAEQFTANVATIFDNDQEDLVLDEEINIDELTITFNSNVNKISENDVFGAAKTLCNLSELGLSVVFGPKSKRISAALQSICSHIGIPFILTSWRPPSKPQVTQSEKNEVTLNLFPEARLLSQGIATIVRGLAWNSFAIIYDSDDSLIKLQEVLKLQQYKKDQSKDTMILKKLGNDHDYRSLLKNIQESHLILDCETDKILEILKQANEMGRSTFSSSFFLTSLDAHTLDFSGLNFTGTPNITTIRLFDPVSINMNAFPEQERNKIRVETALMYDAIKILKESFQATVETLEDTATLDVKLTHQKSCKETEQAELSPLVSKLFEVNNPDFLTGPMRFENGERVDFNLDVIDVFSNRLIAKWSSINASQLNLTRTETQIEKELAERLRTHKFIVISRLGEPYLFKNNDSLLQGNARYYGYSMDLMKAIASEYNISFEFRITDSYKGLIDELITRRADLAIGDLTITHQRREIIDFSMPFMNLGIGILYKTENTDEEVDMYAFLRPFSWAVWMYTATLYLIITVIMFFVSRLSPTDWEKPHPCEENPEELENIWDIKNCFWLTLGSIMTQGCDILPKGISTRLVIAMWWFFSLIMANSYTANMAAFLSKQRMEATIENAEDLAKQSKVKYGLVKGGSTEAFFKNSDDSLYQKMWNTMVTTSPSVFEDDNGKGLNRVNSGQPYAFMMESTQIEYATEINCKLRKVGPLLDSKSYGIGMPLDADYRNSIDMAILKLQENGMLASLREKWWKQQRNGTSCKKNDEEESAELALANVGGVFLVLGIGVALSFALAIIEFLWNVHTISVEEHLSFKDALKAEVKFACNIWVTRKRVKPLLSESSSSKNSSNGTATRSMDRSVLHGGDSLVNTNFYK